MTLLLTLCPLALGSDSWSTPFEGVRLLDRSTSGPLEIRAAEVDLCAPGISLRATASDERQRTPSSFASLVGADLVINGDFFSYDDYSVSGMAIGDGDHWDSDNSSEGFVAFGRDQAWLSPPSRTRPQYRVDLEAPEVQRPRAKTRSADMTPEHRRWTKRDKARRSKTAAAGAAVRGGR